MFDLKVLRNMKGRFHQCLSMCKSLDATNVLNAKQELEGISADKLIYNHAIEMCQSAALEELFGNPEEVSARTSTTQTLRNDAFCSQCFKGYQKAQILLHSLSQQINDQDDKKLLNMYRDAVERRLYVLTSQGIVQVCDNNF